MAVNTSYTMGAPGVIWQEHDLSNFSLPSNQYSVAICGPAEMGPVDRPVLCRSSQDVAQTFGPNVLSQSFALAQAYLIAPGMSVYYKRVVDPETARYGLLLFDGETITAVKEGSPTPYTEADIPQGTDWTLAFFTQNPGEWAQNYGVSIDASGMNAFNPYFKVMLWSSANNVTPAATYKVTLFDNEDGFGYQTQVEAVINDNAQGSQSAVLRVVANPAVPPETILKSAPATYKPYQTRAVFTCGEPIAAGNNITAVLRSGTNALAPYFYIPDTEVFALAPGASAGGAGGNEGGPEIFNSDNCVVKSQDLNEDGSVSATVFLKNVPRAVASGTSVEMGLSVTSAYPPKDAPWEGSAALTNPAPAPANAAQVVLTGGPGTMPAGLASLDTNSIVLEGWPQGTLKATSVSLKANGAVVLTAAVTGGSGGGSGSSAGGSGDVPAQTPVRLTAKGVFGQPRAAAPQPVFFEGATGGILPTNQQVADAYKVFANPEDYDIWFVYGGGNTSRQVVAAVNDLAETRQDCVGFVDVPTQFQGKSGAGDLEAAWSASSGLTSSYTFAYTPNLETVLPGMSSSVFVPPGGPILRAYGQSITNNSVFQAVAGIKRGGLDNVSNVAVRYTPKPGGREVLANNRINPVVPASGGGFCIGDCLTSQSYMSLLSFTNVRLGLVWIKRAILATVAPYNFDNITPQTMFSVTEDLNTLLQPLKDAGLIRDFAVKCDLVNNPDLSASTGMLHIWVAILPAAPAREIIVDSYITKSEAQFAEMGVGAAA